MPHQLTINNRIQITLFLLVMAALVSAMCALSTICAYQTVLQEWQKGISELCLLRTREVERNRADRREQIQQQLLQQGLESGLNGPVKLSELDEDRFIPRIDPLHRQLRGWPQWHPDRDIPRKTLPGKAFSVLDVPNLKCKAEHYKWFHESLRLRPYWRRSMFDHRTKDSYRAWDIACNEWAVM